MAVPIRRLYRFVVGFLLGRDVFGTQFSRPVLGCAWAYSVAAVLQSSTATADCYSCTGLTGAVQQESNQKSGSQLSNVCFRACCSARSLLQSPPDPAVRVSLAKALK